MEYYYALLENYNQLKRRKFKLSLREEEADQGDPQSNQADAHNALKDALAGGAGYDQGGFGKGGNLIFQTKDESKSSTKTGGKEGKPTDDHNAVLTVYVKGAPGYPLKFPGSKIRSTDAGTGGAINWTNKKSAGYKLLVAWSGKGKEEDGGQTSDNTEGGQTQDGPQGETGDGQTEEVFTPAEESVNLAQGLQTLLDGNEEEGIEGMLELGEDGKPKPTQKYFPNYEPAESQSRLQKIVTAIAKKEAGEEQGLGVAPTHLGDASLVEKLYNSPDVDPKQSQQALKLYDTSMRLVQQLQGWNGKPPLPEGVDAATLQDLSAEIKITPNGVTFDGLYFSYRNNASEENDIPYNIAIQINKAIKAHNKSCPEEGSPQYKECHVKELKIPKPPEKREGTDINFARRGTLVEHVAVLGDLGLMADVENCLGDAKSGPAPKKIDCEEVQRLADEKIDEILQDTTTTEQAKAMFAKGMCALGQQCLVNIDDTGQYGDSDEADIAITQQALIYLTGEPPQGEGMSQEQATFILSRVSAKGEDGTRALVIMVAAARGHNEVYADLEILDATVQGKVGSDLPGQKTDTRKIVTEESGEVFIDTQKENMTPEEKTLEELSQCGGEFGWDHALHDVPEDVEEAAKRVGVAKKSKKRRLDIEIKTRTDIDTGRTKMGEGSMSSMREFCNHDPKKEAALDKELEKQEESLRNMAELDAEKAEELLQKADEIALTRERRKLTQDFYNENDARLDKCMKQHKKVLGEAPWGKHGKDKTVPKSKQGKPKSMKDAACEVQKKIDDNLAVSFASLDGIDPVDKDGKIQKNSGEAIVQSWLTAHGGEGASSKNKKRAEGAGRVLAALRARPQQEPKEEDLVDMRKIREDIELAEIKKVLAGGREVSKDDKGHVIYSNDKPLSSEATAYLLFRLSRDGGSLEECVKDVRGMGTHTEQEALDEGLPPQIGVQQRLGCINAGVYGMIAGVMSGELEIRGGILAGKPSAGFSVRTKKSEDAPARTMGGVSFERPGTGSGVNCVTKVGMGALTDSTAAREKARARNTAAHDREDSELIMQFLRGQQELLEKLIVR